MENASRYSLYKEIAQMNRNPKKQVETLSETEEPQPKIMTKPLPEILDELEHYIQRVEEAVKAAQSAAKDSRAHADKAKESGERAAEAARKAAEAAVAKVKEEAAKRADALDDRIAEVSENLDSLVDKFKQEVIALDEAFLALKNKHVEQSPFFKSK
jgi:uncharacterized phage infection (PIP) family protein YhgE